MPADCTVIHKDVQIKHDVTQFHESTETVGRSCVH